jgi:hypothetical protein
MDSWAEYVNIIGEIMSSEFQSGDLKEKDNIRNLEIVKKIILKLISE